MIFRLWIYLGCLRYYLVWLRSDSVPNALASLLQSVSEGTSAVYLGKSAVYLSNQGFILVHQLMDFDEKCFAHRFFNFVHRFFKVSSSSEAVRGSLKKIILYEDIEIINIDTFFRIIVLFVNPGYEYCMFNIIWDFEDPVFYKKHKILVT